MKALGGGKKDAPGAASRRPKEYVEAVEEVSREIRDPVAKLRFLRTSLRDYPRVSQVEEVPSGHARRVLYRWASFEHLRVLSAKEPVAAVGPAVPHRTLVTRAAAALTLLLAAGRLMMGLAALVVVFAVGSAAYRHARPSAAPVLASVPGTAAPHAPAMPPRAGVVPASVWLVEMGAGYEQYSNGLRIENTYEVAGEPRRFRVVDRTTGLRGDTQTRPVGILFHTSESDVWPLEASYNETLRDSTQRLLRYVQRNRLYNYMVDRFGRVYRVVEEETKANHAGHSVWTRGDEVYLSLNAAFLGVSFETRWEGGRALPITQAQFLAGRNLSDYLRARWTIPGDMCVAHGLTSVNPKKHLIGHHVDWARGFPFEAFGLPDQYSRPAPAVALFGFGYDEDFLKIMGEPWAGVREAERALTEEAAKAGRSVEDLRRERQQLYDRWLSDQSQADEATASGRPEPAPAAPAGG
ncbi:MAG TPA: N-acetylmuramoyl-L-alanine amidase [Vicinamibacteria bacterium]